MKTKEAKCNPIVLNVNSQSLESATFIAIDIETTGLSELTDVVIKIDAIKFNREQVLGGFSTLINPCQELSESTQKLTKITNEMLVGAPDLHCVFNQFKEWVGDAVFVDSNPNFTYRFLNSACKEQGYKSFANTTIDTSALARKLYPEWNRFSLYSIAKELDIYGEKTVQETGDAEITRAIFRHLLKVLIDSGYKNINQINGISTVAPCGNR